MAHTHRSFDFLTRGESPGDFVPDLVYRPMPDAEWPGNVLLVDYELPRLRKSGAARQLCAELEDIVEPHRRMLFYVSQFDSFPQVQRDLSAAARILTPSGELRVVVSPRGRPKKVRAAVEEIFADVRVATGSGVTLVIGRHPAPKPYPEQGCEIHYVDPLSARMLHFSTRPGMFSSNQIDTGTEYLLTFLPDLDGRTLLDVGCGWGVIGLVAAARGADVTMMDADARAVKLTRQNLELNGLSAKTLLAQDIGQPDNSFDFVFSNPPTHSGSIVLQSLFDGMVRVCRHSGRIAIVVREHLNYEKWLTKLGTVERAGTALGYKVIRVRKASSSNS
jgi:16S rRNA (guanine1207-N2)-methyltransferase